MDETHHKITSFRNLILKLILKIRVFYLKRRLNNIKTTVIKLGISLNFKLVKEYVQKYGEEYISYCLKLSNITTTKLLSDIVLDEHIEIYEREKNIIEEKIISLRESQEIKQFISDHHLIESFFYETIMNEELSKLYFEKSLKYCDDVKKLTYDSFIKKSDEINKKYKIERKQFWKLRDEIISKKTLSQISKIEISSQNLTYFFGVLTTIFILTGYIYNRFFLGFFGVDVSHFFSVGDYLSTSIDKIYISGVSVLIGITFYIYGIYNNFQTDNRNELLEISPQKDPIVIPFVLMNIMLSISTVLCFYRDLPGKYTFLSLLILLVLMYLYHNLQINKYFDKPVYISIFVVSMIFFSSNIFSSIMNDQDKIYRGNISDLKKFNFTYNTGINFNDNSWVFLTGNSGYFFFYDKELHKSIIVPRTLVKSIETIKK